MVRREVRQEPPDGRPRRDPDPTNASSGYHLRVDSRPPPTPDRRVYPVTTWSHLVSLLERPRPRLLALAGGCVVLALVAAEAALRLFGAYPPPPAPPRVVRWAHLYEAYPPHGYRLVPSRVAAYDYPPAAPRRLVARSNRDGFRGTELGAGPAERRLVVIGDSFVFGEGVAEGERFTDLLAASGIVGAVDNLGLPGFGADLMLRAWETAGGDLRPAAVALCLYTDDFRRVRPFYAGVGFPIPRFALKDGRLVDIPYPNLAGYHRLHGVQLLRHALWTRFGRVEALNGAILDRLLGDVRRREARLGVVFLPGTADTLGDRRRRRWLGNWASRHSVPFLDLTATIHGVSRRHRGARDDVFIAENPHWNPTGHSLAARAMEPFVRRLLGAPPELGRHPGVAP